MRVQTISADSYSRFWSILQHALTKAKDRAYKICSSYESSCSEVDNIKVMLGRNGYPAYFLGSCVRRFFNRKYDKMLSHHEERKHCKTVTARLPSLSDMAMQFKKELSA